jgi:hypothetical protein
MQLSLDLNGDIVVRIGGRQSVGTVHVVTEIAPGNLADWDRPDSTFTGLTSSPTPPRSQSA